jgi:glycosyltransferase involved in cell wall biosynthesis
MQSYYPRLGGAERLLAALAPALQEHGVDVHILTRRYAGLAAFENVAGVPVHRVPIPGPKPVASVSYTLRALPLLRRLRPHILHAHELFSPATTAMVARQFWPTPVVVTAHRSGPIGDVQRLQQKMFGAARLAVFRRRVQTFVAISQEIDAEFAAVGIPPERRVLIPNGVDTQRFAPLSDSDKQALRAALGLPEAPVIVYAGRLAVEKRLDQLIAIWPTIRALYPQALLLLLGTGDQEHALKRAAGAGVRFTGTIDNLVPYFQAADLFVLPSMAEGLSMALLEAMATGLPVLVTAVGGAPDVIDHGQHGWLIPPDTPTALQHAMVTLLGDPVLRRRLGRQGRARIQGDYALPVVARRLYALYTRLVSGASGEEAP